VCLLVITYQPGLNIHAEHFCCLIQPVHLDLFFNGVNPKVKGPVLCASVNCVGYRNRLIAVLWS
jgi:hypothetical protein